MISIACPAVIALGPVSPARINPMTVSGRPRCNVGGPAGESVARGAGKWRLVPVGINRFGQYPAQAIEEGSELWRMQRRSGQPIGMLPDDPAGVRKADHPGWSGVVQERGAKRGDAVSIAASPPMNSNRV